MKKLFLFLIIFSLMVSPAFAFFTKTHEYYVLKGFEEVNSPITQLCANYKEEFLSGVVGDDAPIIHYFDKDFMSYIYTHSRGSCIKLLENSGSDPQLQCFSYGACLHQVMDDLSHNSNGLTSKYLKQELASNLLGHMVVERSYENKLMKLKAKDNIVSSGELDTYDSRMLNIWFPELGGSTKYLELIKSVSNLDFTHDAQVFRSGYLGEGFYDTVYKDKVSLPWWFWSLSIGLMIVGAVLSFVSFKFGKTKWKYIVLVEGLLILFIGGMIFYSVYQGETWKITTFMIEVPASMGYLSVSNEDVILYDKLLHDATNKFLTDGILSVDDVSGRTYYDRNGAKVTGALNEAEKPFRYVLLPIITIVLVILNFLLFRKAFKSKR